SRSLQFLGPGTVAFEQELASVEEALEELWASLAGGLQDLLSAGMRVLDSLAVFGLADPLGLTAVDAVARALQVALDYLWGQHAEWVRRSDLVRRACYVIDLMIATVRGLIEDGVIEDETFDRLDDFDFRSWLLGHGATRATVDSALVRTLV